jgi:hypothetical protein
MLAMNGSVHASVHVVKGWGGGGSGGRDQWVLMSTTTQPLQPCMLTPVRLCYCPGKIARPDFQLVFKTPSNLLQCPTTRTPWIPWFVSLERALC